MSSSSKRVYYSATEVGLHDTVDDCWVSLLGKVFDITSLLNENKGALAAPLIKMAGKDISHWFDEATSDPRTCIDASSGRREYFCPQGPFIHVPPQGIRSDFALAEIPWWRNDELYCIGKLSKKTRFIKIENTLTHHVHTMEVCSEETANEILQRYIDFNGHAGSYTWKRFGRPLDMNKTLEENGVTDENPDFERLGLSDTTYFPCLHLYFNDDLTEA